MKKIFAVIFLMAGSSALAWDLNDVSYLLPLPQKTEQDFLLKVDSHGNRGALLPPDVLQDIPALSNDLDNDQQAGLLRVFGARIDPCFPLPTPRDCQRQLRLVWQPLTRDPNTHAVSTIDAAVHSFYVLGKNEFADLLRDLQSWKKTYPASTAGLPLRVHPAWRSDHDASLKAFEKLILKYAGEKNLIRVTTMILGGADNLWTFVGFQRESGKMRPLRIARLSLSESQTFVNSSSPFDSFRGGFAPKPHGADTLNNLISNSAVMTPLQERTLREEAAAAARIENPKIYTPETMDCVSCHTAQTARLWTERNLQNWGLAALNTPDAYVNARYDLRNNSPEIWNTHSLRAFGYFGREVSVSQRLINESAAVADALNADVF